MKYDHMVKRNGVYYAKGEEVPETALDEKPVPFSDSEITFEENVTPQKQYTKTEIYRMNKAELQQLAANMGAENAESMTGNDLKEYLLNAFGL